MARHTFQIPVQACAESSQRTGAHFFAKGRGKETDDGVELGASAAELYGCFAQNRCKLVAFGAEACEGDEAAARDCCFENTLRALVGGDTALREDRPWRQVGRDSRGQQQPGAWAARKRGCGRFAPANGASDEYCARRADEEYAAWLRRALDRVAQNCSVELDLQLGELRVANSEQLQILEDAIARRCDAADALGLTDAGGEGTRRELQCAEISTAQHRRVRRLVSRRVDLALWDAPDADFFRADLAARAAAAANLAQTRCATWVKAVLTTRATGLCASAIGVGSVLRETGQTCLLRACDADGKELRVSCQRHPPSLSVFERVAHGRRRHWVLFACSDAVAVYY